MTSDDGWVEPVDASKPTAQHDDLEHWLQGIRTDLAGNPPDRLATASTSDAEAPLDAKAPPTSDGDTDPRPRGAQTSGRHRAED